MTAPQEQGDHATHAHEEVRWGRDGRRTRCLLDQPVEPAPLRETCERCGEQVVTREPGSITLTIHAHLEAAEAD